MSENGCRFASYRKAATTKQLAGFALAEPQCCPNPRDIVRAEDAVDLRLEVWKAFS